MKLTFNKKRPLSWSAISSFEYDPEQWYRSYVLNQRDEPTKEMTFGSEFAKSIEEGTCTVPDFLSKLQTKKEHAFKIMFGTICLVGYADAFCDKTFRKLDEIKTGKKPWDQKRADRHGQFDMYLLMNFITNKVPPEEVDCTLYWLPTQDNNDFSISFVEPVCVHAFTTKRTTNDILTFGSRINRVFQEMQDYAANHD